MQRVVLFLTLFLVLSLGCYTYYDPNSPTVTEPDTGVVAYYYNGTPIMGIPTSNTSNTDNVSFSVVYPDPSPKSAHSIEAGLVDSNWLSPGKVSIGNFYKGAQAEYVMRIHNGGDKAAVFNIRVRQPDSNPNALPLDCLNWVQIPLQSLLIQPKGTYEMMVTVTMLKDTNMKGKNYEFWVSVIDGSQSGMLQTELCGRWLISTRK